MQKKPITKEKALQRMESLCSRSEQCEWELTQKLIRWGIRNEHRNEIIEILKKNRYLDDYRFARSFALDKARFSAWGPSKIRMELIRRKIRSQTITDSLQNIEHQIWKDALLKNAVAKSKELDLTGSEAWENRNKLLRYLIYRGFPSAAANKAADYMKKVQEKEQENDQEMD